MEGKLIENVLRHYLDDHNTGVFPRDRIRITRAPTAYVLNTDPHNKKGEHWVAVYINERKVGHYFDSYGLPPYHEEFIIFLQNYCKHWIYSDQNIQGFKEKTCGHFCIFFLIHMSEGWSMEQIIKVFNSDFDKNNKIVKSFARDIIKSM